MKALIEKISNNENEVVKTHLEHQGKDPINLYTLPKVGERVWFETKIDTLVTTPVKDLEWALDRKTLTFWTKNSEYKLTFDEPVNG
jgi:hypothetical protein